MNNSRSIHLVKKTLWLALIFAACFGFSITASYADVAPGCNDGTQTNGGAGTQDGEGGIWGIMQTHKQAMVLANKAITDQMVKQTDSQLALTCFDKSLALTSRLGSIFSDVLPKNIAAPVNKIFGKNFEGNFNEGYSAPNNNNFGIKYVALGVDKTLGTTMQKMLDKGGQGILTNYLNGGNLQSIAGVPSGLGLDNILENTNQNFAKSLSAQMGYTVTGALSGIFDSVFGSFFNGVNNILAQVQSFMASVNSTFQAALDVLYDVKGVLNVINTIGSIVSGLGFGGIGGAIAGVMTSVFAVYDQVMGVVNQVVQAKNDIFAAINGVAAGVTSVQSLLQGFLSLLMGVDTSMAGLVQSEIDNIVNNGLQPPQRTGCNAMMDMWYGIDGSESVVGSGVQTGAPFFTYEELVTKNIPGAGGAAGMASAAAGTLGLVPAKTGLLDFINSPGNVSILNKAQADLQRLKDSVTGGPSAAPGGISSYKAPLTIPSTYTAAEVVCAISGQVVNVGQDPPC